MPSQTAKEKAEAKAKAVEAEAEATANEEAEVESRPGDLPENLKEVAKERANFPPSVHGTNRFQVVVQGPSGRVYGKRGEPVSPVTSANQATWLANRFNKLDPEQRGKSQIILPGGGSIVGEDQFANQ